MVINYLASTAQAAAQGESDANFRPLGLIEQGEGEGNPPQASAPLGALMEAPRDPATPPAAAGQGTFAPETPGSPPPSEAWWLATRPSEAQPTLRKVGSSNVDAQAADDLFALLGTRGDR
jgi:hypothetical protein